MFGESGVKSVSLPSTLEILGDGVFMCCENLEEIQLPEQLRAIEQDCFWNSGLKSIRIPRSVAKIGADAFS